MVEQMTLTPDQRFVVYSANTGDGKNDLDRRHIYKVPVDGSSSPAALTSGVTPFAVGVRGAWCRLDCGGSRRAVTDELGRDPAG